MKKIALNNIVSILGIQNWRIFLNALVRSGAAGLALIAQFFLIRLLGEVGYGEYVKFITQVSLLAVLVRLGSDVSIVRTAAFYSMKGDAAGLKRLVCKAIIASVLLTFIITTFLYILSYLGVPHGFSDFLVVGLSLFFLVAGMQLLCVLRGLGKALEADLIDAVARPILLIVLFAILVFLSGYVDASSIPKYGYVICCAFISLILLFLVNYSGKKIKAVCVDRAVDNVAGFSFSASVVMATLCSYGIFQLDTLILSSYVSKIDLGAYNVVCNYVRLIIFFPMIISAQMQPKFVQKWFLGDKEGFCHLVKKSLFIGFCSSVFFLAVFAFFSEFIMAMTSPSYVGFGHVLIIISLGHVFNGLAIISAAALNMIKKEFLVFKCALLGAIVASTLYCLLIPSYGVWGAAISASCGMIAMAASLSWILWRVIEKKDYL